LGVASALATVGMIWLAVKASDQMPEWARAGVASPLALRCLGIIVVGMLALAGMALVLVRPRPAAAGGQTPGVRGFHADQGGTAAIEMALLFPLGLMIFLTVTQGALLFNANMVTHYAAFCAARTATVVVPLDWGTWNPGGGEAYNGVYCPTYAGNPQSDKLAIIRRAAVLAVLPVSARIKSGMSHLDPYPPNVDTSTKNAFSRVGGGSGDPAWFKRIQSQYNYADGAITKGGEQTPVVRIEIAEPEHWREGHDQNNDCPNHNWENTGEWGGEGAWVYQWVCPGYPDRYDYAEWEELYVRLTHQYLLEVPYASRFLGDEVSVPDRQGKQYAAEIRVVVSLSNEGGWELRPATP
jgi:hypothetical protein